MEKFSLVQAFPAESKLLRATCGTGGGRNPVVNLAIRPRLQSTVDGAEGELEVESLRLVTSTVPC